MENKIDETFLMNELKLHCLLDPLYQRGIRYGIKTNIDETTYNQTECLIQDVDNLNITPLGGAMKKCSVNFSRQPECETEKMLEYLKGLPKGSTNSKTVEIQSVYKLTECHGQNLKINTLLSNELVLAEHADKSNITPPVDPIKNLSLSCNMQMEFKVEEMLEQLKEMPKEWIFIQLTPKWNGLENVIEDSDRYCTEGLHISVLHCGPNAIKPFYITTEAPKDPVNGQPVELVNEIMSIIQTNKEILTLGSTLRVFRSLSDKKSYLYKRKSIEDRLKYLVRDIQDLWLKEWRCLLTGKFCNEVLEEQVKSDINNLCAVQLPGIDMNDKVKTILACVIKNCHNLKLSEIKSVVKYCFPEKDNYAVKAIVQVIKSLNDKIKLCASDLRKYPVLLILHEAIDAFPWEMLDILKDEPVTRVPSLQFAYSLYKAHESDIEGGYKIMKDYSRGSYVVNPDSDLHNMEVRIMNFLNYWIPNWIGTSGYNPKHDEFLEHITSADIFLYAGHGNGSHLVKLQKLKTGVKAVVLLFGCGSVRKTRLDPQVAMYGNYQLYLMARCPCVVGMLWEVTDVDTDVLTTDFLSYWIPSEAPTHWKYVDKSSWKMALGDKIDFKKSKSSDNNKHWQPELLRALNQAKIGLSYYSTKAACVVRGLPVKIQLH